MDMTKACLFLGHHKTMNYSSNSRWGQLNRSMLQAYIAEINCNIWSEGPVEPFFSFSTVVYRIYCCNLVKL